jgi:hypothetical protein
LRPFLIQSPWEGSKSFLLEDLPDCGRAEPDVAFLEDLADLVDRVVLLP